MQHYVAKYQKEKNLTVFLLLFQTADFEESWVFQYLHGPKDYYVYVQVKKHIVISQHFYLICYVCFF